MAEKHNDPDLTPEELLRLQVNGTQDGSDADELEEDEMALDMTNPEVSFMVGIVVTVFKDVQLDSVVPELQGQIQEIYTAYESAEDEFVLIGDAIPVFVYMVYQIAAIVESEEMELESSDEFLDAVDEFLAQVEDNFPELIEELEAGFNQEDDEDLEDEDFADEDPEANNNPGGNKDR
jgi:hypothetical protein